MIRNPIDITTRVSPELSTLIEDLIQQLETDEPVTLGALRSFVAQELPAEISEIEHLHHFDDSESLVDELDALIENFGESAAAEDFIAVMASEALSRAMERVIYDENRENVATLESVHDALTDGLAGRLVGDGVLEDDEAETLLPELETLVTRFGSDALAENFLRYE